MTILVFISYHKKLKRLIESPYFLFTYLRCAAIFYGQALLLLAQS